MFVCIEETCEAKVSGKGRRCRSCANKVIWKERGVKPKKYCLDCGKEISKDSIRCNSCAQNHRREKEGTRRSKQYCIDCGKEITCEATRCWDCYCVYVKVKHRTDEFRSKQSKRLLASWDKRGRKPRKYCTDCGKEINRYGKSLLCSTCRRTSQKIGPNSCLDCGKEIGKDSVRCLACYNEFRRAKPNYCIDCKIKIWGGSTRCRKCDGIIRRGIPRSEETKQKLRKANKGQIPWLKGKTGVYSEETLKKKSESLMGHPVSKEQRRKQSIAQKANWREGKYNGVFKSPTRPERDLMAALDELGIWYIPQMRIESYPYDIYLVVQDVMIEYDGWHWHHSNWAEAHEVPKRDALKDQLAKEMKIPVIRITRNEQRDLTYNEIYARVKEELDACRP